jgi:hypothetical protein
MSGKLSDDALYDRLADVAAKLVEEPQHTPLLAKVLASAPGVFSDVSALAPAASLVAVELLRIKRDHGARLMATHLPCPDGDPRDDEESPKDVSMVVFYIPELAAIAETALLDRVRIFELSRS